MGIAIADARVAAAIAKCIELLDIAKRGAGLLRHPVAKSDLECPMAHRIERPRRQCRDCARIVRAGRQNQRLVT